MKGLKGHLIYDPMTEQEKASLGIKAKKAREAKAQKKLEAAQQTANEFIKEETQKVENRKEAAKKTKKSKATVSEAEELVKQDSAVEVVSEKAVAKKKTTRTRAKKAVPAAEEAV